MVGIGAGGVVGVVEGQQLGAGARVGGSAVGGGTAGGGAGAVALFDGLSSAVDFFLAAPFPRKGAGTTGTTGTGSEEGSDSAFAGAPLPTGNPAIAGSAVVGPVAAVVVTTVAGADDGFFAPFHCHQTPPTIATVSSVAPTANRRRRFRPKASASKSEGVEESDILVGPASQGAWVVSRADTEEDTA